MTDKQSSWFKRHKIFTALLVLITLFSLISAIRNGVGNDSPHTSSVPDLASKSQSKPEKPKEDTSELNGDVKFSSTAFQITNNEDKDWTGCLLKLNDKYQYKNASIPKRGNVVIDFNDFTLSDGTRFNYITTAPKSLYIGMCQGMSELRYGYYGIGN